MNELTLPYLYDICNQAIDKLLDFTIFLFRWLWTPHTIPSWVTGEEVTTTGFAILGGVAVGYFVIRIILNIVT